MNYKKQQFLPLNIIPITVHKAINITTITTFTTIYEDLVWIYKDLV